MKIHIPHTTKKRVVIVGGGFGGLTLAEAFDSRLFQVVLIDRNNYHQFQPLLYQVASSGLNSSSISFPFRTLMRKKKDFFFRLAEVLHIDTAANRIETSIGELAYDYLVLAAGTTTNFFGNADVERNALPMKSIEEALELRNTLLENLEKALNCSDIEERTALLNVVIVGGGATGVEVAGAMAEMKRFVMPRDYPDLQCPEMNIYLVEGMDKVLGVMSKEASASALRFLEKMGVNVMLGKMVTGYEDGRVVFKDGQSIPTRTLIWVSGVTANRFAGLPDGVAGRGGRIFVDQTNHVQGLDNVFAIGDICLQSGDKAWPNGHPQVAPVAIQQGHLLADNLRALEKGQPLKPFSYHDKGTLATIGRNKAVADIHRLRLSGFPAWVVWMLVHLRSILGVRNKIMVLINWMWNYFTYDQSLRFILYIPRRNNG